MQPNHLDCPARRRRPARLLAFLLLLSLAAFTAACPSDDTPPETNPGVNTDPTPVTGADDRPIIITGGSLDLQYNTKYYAPSGNVFRSANNRITRLRVFNDTQNNVAPCEDTFNAGSRIVIGYDRQGGGTGGEIVVTSSEAQGQWQVEISYNTTDLPRRHNNSKKHFNKDLNLQTLTYEGGNNPAQNKCSLGNAGQAKRMTIELDGISVDCVVPVRTPTPARKP